MSFSYLSADVCNLNAGGRADRSGTLAHDVIVEVLTRKRKLLRVVVSLGNDKDVVNGGENIRCDERQTGGSWTRSP